LYLQQGKLEEAKKTLKKAIQINPDVKTFHDNLGLVFLEMGHLEKACDEFEAALQISPKDIKTKLNLAHAYRKLNNLPKAIEYFEEIDQGLSQSHLTECLYLNGQNKKLLKKIEAFGNSKVSDPLIGAVTEHSRVTLNHSFCNSFCSHPLSYIYRANINNSGTAEKTFKDIEKFAYSKTCDYKSQSLLINGTQTSGNLLNLNEPFVKPLSGIIDNIVKAYRNKFKQ
jgi:Tfp pilus assembly protein PilF